MLLEHLSKYKGEIYEQINNGISTNIKQILKYKILDQYELSNDGIYLGMINCILNSIYYGKKVFWVMID